MLLFCNDFIREPRRVFQFTVGLLTGIIITGTYWLTMRVDYSKRYNEPIPWNELHNVEVKFNQL